MLYFAYGSNMDCSQMRTRCPSASFIGIAKFPNHKIDFTRKSTRRGCGVADVVRQDGAAVWGVVYEITDSDLAQLDKDEGYREGRPASANSYVREQRQVLLNGNEGNPLSAWTYIANPQPNPPLANADYKALLVNSAKFWRLPADYLQQLENIRTVR